MDGVVKDILFTDLSTEVWGGDEPEQQVRKIDGMAAGAFTDMWGREFVIERADLTNFVTNTKLALESTRDKDGKVVGFPIDQRGHYHEDAAGFITDAELDGNIVRLSVRWNETGKYLISEELERYVSPSIDLEQKVIVGGSLTNWPATRTKDHKILLRPVELSANMKALDGIEAERMSIIEAVRSTIKEVLDGAFRVGTPDKPSNDEEDVMELSELTTEQKLSLRSEVEKELIANPNTSAELSSYLEREVNQRMEEALAAEKRKLHIADFSARIVGGTKDTPRGLPTTQDEIAEFMGALPVDLQEKAEALFEKIVENGLLEFSEVGHNQAVKGKIELPEEIKPMLHAALKEGRTAEWFFASNMSELGQMDDYDLSEFKIKENK